MSVNAIPGQDHQLRPGAGVFRTHLGRRKSLMESLTAGANKVQILASHNVDHGLNCFEMELMGHDEQPHCLW